MSSQHLTLDNTLGAGYIGVIAAALLHGVSCLQAWYYFTHHNDRWPTKALVSAVMIFDTIHQMLISHTIYIYLITDFGDVASLDNIVWSLIAEVIFNGLTALLVQSFLAARLWRVSNRNIWLTGLVLFLVIGEFSCVVAFTCMGLRLHTFAQLADLKPLSVTVNVLAAAGDLLIAASLCTLLHKSRTGFHRSNTMINKLILLVVSTGCFTSLCAVASLISIVAAGETFLYIAFFFCIGRLYSNSLLTTLNSRNMIRDAADGIHGADDSFSLRKIPKAAPTGSRVCSFPVLAHSGGPLASSSHASTGTNDISIKIDTTKECVTDRDSYQRRALEGVQGKISVDLIMDEKGESLSSPL
jgi:hypothetical protein